MPLRRTASAGALLVLAAALAVGASAKEAGPQATTLLQGGFVLGGIRVFPARLHSGGMGSVSRQHAALDLRTNVTKSGRLGLAPAAADMRTAVAPAGMLDLVVDQEFSQYDFVGSQLPDELQGAHDTVSTLAGLSVRTPLPRDWFGIGLAYGKLSAETDAAWGRAAVYGGELGAGRQVSPELTVSLVVSAQSYLEKRDWLVYPLPRVDWRITDRLSLHSSRGFLLTYAPDARRRWELGLSALYESRQYRLKGSRGGSGGALEDDAIPVQFSARYAPSRFLLARFFAGAMAWRYGELRREHGHQVYGQHADPCAFVGGDAALHF